MSNLIIKLELDNLKNIEKPFLELLDHNETQYSYEWKNDILYITTEHDNAVHIIPITHNSFKHTSPDNIYKAFKLAIASNNYKQSK